MPATDTLKIRAWTDKASSEWTEVASDAHEISIVLAGGATGSLTGLLIDSGRPTEKRTVLLTLPGEGSPNSLKSRGMVTTEPGGRFHFDNLATGSYKLWVRRAGEQGPEWTAYAGPVSIDAQRDASIVFNVPSGVPANWPDRGIARAAGRAPGAAYFAGLG